MLYYQQSALVEKAAGEAKKTQQVLVWVCVLCVYAGHWRVKK
jgi:hypothetical protein